MAKRNNPPAGKRPSAPVHNVQAPTAELPSPEKPPLDRQLIFLSVVLAFVALIRFGLLDIPLERDEGEYAYIGKLILEGIAPYKSAYNMKLPGTYGMYALIMAIFGHTISGIHLGLLFTNLATSLFLFFGFRKLYNSTVGFFTASVFALMTLSPNFLGFAAHATHFIAFFVSIGILFLSKFFSRQSGLSSFLTGCMFGLAFLMKQQAVFFILFGGLAVLIIALTTPGRKLGPVIMQVLCYGAGVFLPYVLTVLILAASGAFDNFWFWTVTYATKYVGRVTWEEGKMLLSMTFQPMWIEFKFLWVLFFAGFVLTFLTKFTLAQKLVAILFAIFAFLTVSTGLYFRSHYFIAFLPAVGLLAAMSVHYFTDMLSRVLKVRAVAFLPLILFAIVFISVVKSSEGYYLKPDPLGISQACYGANPFIESVEIAEYIKRNSTEKDKIAIMGSEPQICLYADRHSATGYIYTYSLVEDQPYNLKMQKEMIQEIETEKPLFMVSCVVNFSWLRNNKAPSLIFDWFTKYVNDNYNIVGVADMVPGGPSVYKWDNDVLSYSPKSENFVLVFKRKPSAATASR